MSPKEIVASSRHHYAQIMFKCKFYTCLSMLDCCGPRDKCWIHIRTIRWISNRGQAIFWRVTFLFRHKALVSSIFFSPLIEWLHRRCSQTIKRLIKSRINGYRRHSRRFCPIPYQTSRNSWVEKVIELSDILISGPARSLLVFAILFSFGLQKNKCCDQKNP